MQLKVDIDVYMGVSNNRGTPKCMVYNGNPIKMGDLGVPLFSETPYIPGDSICDLSGMVKRDPFQKLSDLQL